ncbi:MAG: HEAT repeat domain-containing protein, partial [Cyanobacteria bacterium J06639_18]
MVNAQKVSKPKPQDWHINGIIAALDDSDPKVQGNALNQLGRYETQELKATLKKPEDVAQTAIKLLTGKNVELEVRRNAVGALKNLGDAAKPYLKDMLELVKDTSFDPGLRYSTLEVFGSLGSAAKPYVKDIADILTNKNLDFGVRAGAVRVLGNLGELTQPYVEDIADILKDKTADDLVRAGAVRALGNLGDAAKPYVKDILKFLKDETVGSQVRGNATEALVNLGDIAKPYIGDIFELLKDQKIDFIVRGAAASAFGKMGDATIPYVQEILELLKDKTVDQITRFIMGSALTNLGDLAKPYVKDIVDILQDKTIDSQIRQIAIQALGNLGDATKPYVKNIVDILKDEKLELYLRGSAARALGNLGEVAKDYIEDIGNILKYKAKTLNESNLRGTALEALGNLGEAAKLYVKDILYILKDKTINYSDRKIAAEALRNIKQKPLELKEFLIVLNNAYYDSLSTIPQWRFLGYFVSGGSHEAKTLIKWLAYPQTTPEKLTHSEGVKILNLFLKVWEVSTTEGLTELRDDLAEKIAVVAANKNVNWLPQDITLLQKHYKNLKQINSTHAETIQSEIINLEGWRWFFKFRNIILTHAAFWLALIFAYPKSPQIQAIFFWNPWVRRIAGMGYVGFLLTWVPFLRRKLLEPFQRSLLADARLDNFTEAIYFPESCVKPPASDKIVPITKVLPNVKGQIVLEGDSGLGKSMFLCHLLKNTSNIAVYLPAYKCEKGVIEAIQEKLRGQAQDVNFLKSLIYSGAIDIYIDGLNEVTADTRSQIKQFVESYFHCNIIMTTQPLQWESPSTAKTFILKPLTKQQISQFLTSRSLRLPADAKLKDDSYKQACKNYLIKILDPQQPATELEANYRVLSNPMDLTLISQMLSQGEHPDLFRLQEQQYNLMAWEYKREWKHDFPLKKFSQRVYQQRINDESAILADEFDQEVFSMEDQKYKMVVSRQWKNIVFP